MNLNQLRFASAVAGTQSFTAAAAACCVTQPTLSNAIAQLEEELGQRLFVRTTRKVALTPFGEHMLPAMAEVLNAQSNLLRQAALFLHPEQRMIRIGLSPLVNATLLNLMIEPFRRQHGDIEVIFRDLHMADLYQMLERDKLDFVFSAATGPAKTPWAKAFLYREPLLYMPPQGRSPRARGAAVSLNDIADETFVMVPDSCGLAGATRALFRRHRRKLREYAGEAMSYQVLEEWAQLGIGAAILPASKVSDNAAALSIMDRTGKAAVLDFQVAWSTAAPLHGHLQAFARHLRDVAPAIAAGLGRTTAAP